MSDATNGGKRPEPPNTPARQVDDEVLPRLSEEHRHNSTDLERDPEKLDSPGVFGQEDAAEPDGGPVSRASSARSRPRVVIPRSKQRGLFARFTVIPELEDPYTYANRTKWCITAVVAVAGGVGPLGSGIFYRRCTRLSSLKPRDTDHIQPLSTRWRRNSTQNRSQST